MFRINWQQREEESYNWWIHAEW